MSWQRTALNAWLRRVERPALARIADPVRLRRRFERQARWLFRAPKGTKIQTHPLGLYLRPNGAIRRRIVYVHGGAFAFGAPHTHAAMVAHIARAAQADAILLRYPLAPEHPFPAAGDAVLDGWQQARAQCDLPMILGGDSAGGCLALTALSGGAAPDAVFAFSPLTDLTFSGASFDYNADIDVVLPPERAEETAQTYLAQRAEPRDPRVSPLFAQYPSAPPIWLAASLSEVLLDDTRRLATRLGAQAVPVTLNIEPDLPHVWPLFHNYLPEAKRTIRVLGQWIKTQVPSSRES